MNVDVTCKLDFFERTETKPEEWMLCEPIDYDTDDWGNVLFPRFRVEHSYKFVPEFDNIKSTNWENLHEDDKRCRLCGQKLVHCFIIKHDGKKFVTIIGRECAKKYPYLNLEAQIKQMLEKKYQPTFMSWGFYAIKRILSREEFQQEGYKRKMKTISRVRLHLKEEPRKLHSMLLKLKNEKIGYQKMRKILRIADELRIPIPRDLLPIINKKNVRPLVSLDSYFA